MLYVGRIGMAQSHTDTMGRLCENLQNAVAAGQNKYRQLFVVPGTNNNIFLLKTACYKFVPILVPFDFFSPI